MAGNFYLYLSREYPPPINDCSSLMVLDTQIGLLKKLGLVSARMPEGLPSLARVMDAEMARRIFSEDEYALGLIEKLAEKENGIRLIRLRVPDGAIEQVAKIFSEDFPGWQCTAVYKDWKAPDYQK